MRVLFFVAMIVIGGAGIAGLVLTAENTSDLFGLYDARGIGFIASIVLVVLGALLLLLGAGKKTAKSATKVENPERTVETREPESQPDEPTPAEEPVHPAEPTPAMMQAEPEFEAKPEPAPEPALMAPIDPRRDEAEAAGDALVAEARAGVQDEAMARAADAYREAAALTPAEDTARLALINAKAGKALLMKARASQAAADADASISAYARAADLLRDSASDAELSGVLFDRGEAHWLKYELTEDAASLEGANEAFAVAAALVPKEKDAGLYARNEMRHANTLRLLGAQRGSVDMLRDAVERFKEALNACDAEAAPFTWVSGMEQLAFTLESMPPRDSDPDLHRRDAISVLEMLARRMPELNLKGIDRRVARVNREIERIRQSLQNTYSQA